MGELTTSGIANICPHCGGKNIKEEDSLWTNLDASTMDGNLDVIVSLDMEGRNYFLYAFECKDCGTLFCIKRLNEQTN